MTTRSAILLHCLILTMSAPACGEQAEEAFYSTQLPLRVLHAKAHGLPPQAIDYEAALERRSLFETDGAEKPSNTEIGFERTGCLGTCPSDSLRLLQTGEAHYWGEKYVPRKGCHRANLSPETYRILSVVADEIGIWDMQDTYAVLDTDASSTYTALRREGEHKIIWNYSNAGPVELWLFEELIQKLAHDLEWAPVEETESAAECLGLK